MSLDSDHLPEVREQYERLPYPPCDPEDDNRRLVTTWLDDLPMVIHYCFGGAQSFARGFRVLVAGGGTGDGTIYLAEQLRATDAEIVHLDLSEASINIARRRAEIRKLENIRWVQIYGAIFGAEADLTHPLAFGYNQKTVSLFKANKVFMEKSKNPYATPFMYGPKSMQSGWVSRENGEAIKNSAAVIVNTVGNGRVINIADNPNLRAFWLGGVKLFMNAIFFGRIIDAASGRTDE